MTKPAKLALAALALVVAGCCAALLLPKEGGGTVAVVTHNGKTVREIDLSTLKESTVFTVEGENGLRNVIVAEPGRIRVKDATCPDHVCVNQGWITDSALPIVCLPNQLIIQIQGGEGQYDGATG